MICNVTCFVHDDSQNNKHTNGPKDICNLFCQWNDSPQRVPWKNNNSCAVLWTMSVEVDWKQWQQRLTTQSQTRQPDRTSKKRVCCSLKPTFILVYRCSKIKLSPLPTNCFLRSTLKQGYPTLWWTSKRTYGTFSCLAVLNQKGCGALLKGKNQSGRGVCTFLGPARRSRDGLMESCRPLCHRSTMSPLVVMCISVDKARYDQQVSSQNSGPSIWSSPICPLARAMIRTSIRFIPETQIALTFRLRFLYSFCFSSLWIAWSSPRQWVARVPNLQWWPSWVCHREGNIRNSDRYRYSKTLVDVFWRSLGRARLLVLNHVALEQNKPHSLDLVSWAVCFCGYDFRLCACEIFHFSHYLPSALKNSFFVFCHCSYDLWLVAISSTNHAVQSRNWNHYDKRTKNFPSLFLLTLKCFCWQFWGACSLVNTVFKGSSFPCSYGGGMLNAQLQGLLTISPSTNCRPFCCRVFLPDCDSLFSSVLSYFRPSLFNTACQWRDVS